MRKKDRNTILIFELKEALERFQRSKLVIDKCISQEINKGQVSILRAIDSLGNEVSPTEVSEYMQITRGAVTHHINDLQKLGYIEKKISTEDRRVYFLKLSEKGEEFLKMMNVQQKADMEMIIEQLGSKDSKSLIKIINKLNDINTK